MTPTTRYAPLIARILMAGIFLFSGYGKLTDLAGTAAYIASMGLPMPTVSALGAGVVEVGCGLLLVLGYRVTWAAALLLVYMIPVTTVFESPLGAEGRAWYGAMVDFLKNLAIMGGLLLLAVHGGGRVGPDARGGSGATA